MPKLKKIIIVEDERPMARALELKLNNSGFNAKVVYNGEDLFKILSKEKPHLILLDLVMPIMDGFEVLERLKKEKKRIPIIVTSNLSQEEDIKKAEKLGAKNFFVKSNTPIATIVNYIKTNFK